MPGTEGGSITNTKASRRPNIWARRSARIAADVSFSLVRSAKGFSVTKTTPVLGALVKVAPSRPAKATAFSTPGRDSGAFERAAGRQLKGGDEIAAVELRDQPGRGRDQEVSGEAEQPGIKYQHDHAAAHHPLGGGAVEARHALEAVVEVPEEPAHWRLQPVKQAGAFMAGLMRFQQESGQRRRQGKRHEGRDRRRGGDGDGELAVERALQAGDEGG